MSIRHLFSLALLLGSSITASTPQGGSEGRSSHAFLGPIIAEVTHSGFAVNIGQPDAPPATARLLVFDAASRPGPEVAPLAQAADSPATWHLLRVSGLAPERRYRYRVLLSDAPIADGEITTAPPPGTERSLRIAVLGDERGYGSHVAPYAATVVRSILDDAPDLVLGTGDIVARGGDPAGWRDLMYSHGPMWAKLLYLPALGNHELLGDPEARGFRALFPQAARRFYAVRYAQVLLLFLDGNRPGSADQTRFLDEELARARLDPGVRRRLVILHQAPFSVATHCGMGEAMAPWIERFERFGVDAVLSGHDHTYQRLERNGVAYFVSGGGGAPLYGRSECAPADLSALQRFESVHHYLLLHIDASRESALSVVARSPQGAPFDRVTLPLPRMAAPVLAPPAPLAMPSRTLSGAEILLATSLPLLILGTYLLRRRRAATRATRS